MLRSLIIGILLSILIVSCVTEESWDIDVITFNIRMDTPLDSINAWPNRAPLVAGFINDQVPDLLGMQEVLWHQYQYLDFALTGYGSVAAGRDDGMQLGEHVRSFTASGGSVRSPAAPSGSLLPLMCQARWDGGQR